MRWMLGVAAAIVVAVVLYLGSALSSLDGLVGAAKAGDGAGVVARTDMERLRRSLVDQIIAAYIDRVGRGKPLGRMVANTYGASVADAMLQKLLTAENLTTLLRTGAVSGAASVSIAVPGLETIDPSRLWDVLARLQWIQVREIAIRTSDSSDPETASGLTLHFEGSDWKLSGLTLPKKLTRELAATLPVK